MYRALTDSKLLCGLTHCRIVIYNVFGYFYGSFFYIAFQRKSPAILVFTLYAEDLLLCMAFLSHLYSILNNPFSLRILLPLRIMPRVQADIQPVIHHLFSILLFSVLWSGLQLHYYFHLLYQLSSQR